MQKLTPRMKKSPSSSSSPSARSSANNPLTEPGFQPGRLPRSSNQPALLLKPQDSLKDRRGFSLSHRMGEGRGVGPGWGRGEGAFGFWEPILRSRHYEKAVQFSCK